MPGTYSVEVLEHRKAAEDHWELVLPREGRLREAKPGQFVHVATRNAESLDPLLRRPFSFFRETSESVSLLYRVVGRGTRFLAGVRAGDKVDLIGPLGRGFWYEDLKRDGGTVLLVGGGVGVPPLFHLSQRLAEAGLQQRACVGFATGAFALGLSEWKELGVDVDVATDDGTLGRWGLVTELAAGFLERAPVARVFACGPKGMLAAVARIAARQGVSCQVAMEEWMGCGVGACLSCVCRVKAGDGGSKWARVCREGPVFPADEVVWAGA